MLSSENVFKAAPVVASHMAHKKLPPIGGESSPFFILHISNCHVFIKLIDAYNKTLFTNLIA